MDEEDQQGATTPTIKTTETDSLMQGNILICQLLYCNFC